MVAALMMLPASPSRPELRAKPRLYGRADAVGEAAGPPWAAMSS